MDYIDSGVEWIGNIPNNWKIEKVKYNFKNTKEIVGIRVNNYERLALTLNGVVKRSKEDDNGLQPDNFETYQILRKNELVFKLIDLQNVSTSRIGLSNYEGIVSPAYIILKEKTASSSENGSACYFISWSILSNRLLLKNSRRVISKPSQSFLIVTTPGFWLFSFKRLYTDEGGMPEMFAKALMARSRSLQSSMILAATASFVFTYTPPFVV